MNKWTKGQNTAGERDRWKIIKFIAFSESRAMKRPEKKCWTKKNFFFDQRQYKKIERASS